VRAGVTAGYRYAVDYRRSTATTTGSRGGGDDRGRMVILAAGAMGTPVILQRSAGHLGGIPTRWAGTSPRTATASPWP
jgi:enediyne biosynthesis protein E9